MLIYKFIFVFKWRILNIIVFVLIMDNFVKKFEVYYFKYEF